MGVLLSGRQDFMVGFVRLLERLLQLFLWRSNPRSASGCDLPSIFGISMTADADSGLSPEIQLKS